MSAHETGTEAREARRLLLLAAIREARGRRDRDVVRAVATGGAVIVAVWVVVSTFAGAFGA